jgi:hypothetical protein
MGGELAIIFTIDKRVVQSVLFATNLVIWRFIIKNVCILGERTKRITSNDRSTPFSETVVLWEQFYNLSVDSQSFKIRQIRPVHFRQAYLVIVVLQSNVPSVQDTHTAIADEASFSKFLSSEYRTHSSFQLLPC